ncbi:MAG: peptidase M48, partial [Candidatus Omnitrophica bacterium CG12_big_fil_rev_8_21_14_0_65_50_5]
VLAAFWSAWFSDPLTHGLALIISAVLLISILEIPLSYYRTFVIEEHFGFNKMTSAMFFADLIKHTTIGLLLGVPLLFCFLWLMEKMGANWWLYA